MFFFNCDIMILQLLWKIVVIKLYIILLNCLQGLFKWNNGVGTWKSSYDANENTIVFSSPLLVKFFQNALFQGFLVEDLINILGEN